MITVQEINSNTFDVTVRTASPTTHRVKLSDDYHRRLTGGKTDKKELIRRSFEFLLERESNTMIFTEFDLPVIERYFKNYPLAIKQALSF